MTEKRQRRDASTLTYVRLSAASFITRPLSTFTKTASLATKEKRSKVRLSSLTYSVAGLLKGKGSKGSKGKGSEGKRKGNHA